MDNLLPISANRRRFVKFVVGTAVTIPLVNITACSEQPAAVDAPPKEIAPKPSSPAAATTSTPAATANPASAVSAADLPKLSETDPTAVALGYRHDATEVDTTKHPRRSGPEGEKQFCYNCTLFNTEEDVEWAGCTLFPGKGVNRNGWCSGWVEKT